MKFILTISLLFSIVIGVYAQCTPATSTMPDTGTASTFASGFSVPYGITIDGSGNLYVANSGNNTVSKITASGTVSTFATGLNNPSAITIDVNGNLYVANSGNGTVSKITSSGTVSGFATGLNNPIGITIDGSGNLYVTNNGSSTVSKITSSGAVSTFATGLSSPTGITIDGSGNLYVSKAGNTINKITPLAVVSTFASGLSSPYGITIDGSGNLYVANSGNNTISKITSSGVVSTFASGLNEPYGITIDGNGNLYITNFLNNTVSKIATTIMACNSFTFGGQTLTASGTYSDTITGGAVSGCDSIVTLQLTINVPSATFIPTPTVSTFATGLNHPEGITIDHSGNLYVANNGNGTVSKITPSGTVSTFASGLNQPTGITIDGSGNLYVTNNGNNTVSKITSSGVVSTFATGLNSPYGITIDGSGNLYVANFGNNTVSKITSLGIVSTFASGLNGPTGITIDGSGNLYVGNNGNGTVSQITPSGIVSTFATGLSSPTGITIDGSGYLFVTTYSSTVREITPSGTVFPFASGLSFTYGITIDGSGNLYVSNFGNNTVSKIAATTTACSSYTFRGQTLTASGTYSDTITSSLVGGCDSIVQLHLRIINKSTTTLIDTACGSYTFRGRTHTVSGTYSDTITGGSVNGCDSIVTLHLTVNALSTTIIPTPTVSTFASGLSSPNGIAIDGNGNLYVANYGNNTVSKITSSGTVSIFASGFNEPYGIAIDGSGNLYVTNLGDSTVRKVTPSGTVSTFASGFANPKGITIDGRGNLYIANNGSSTVSMITPSGTVSPFIPSGLNRPAGVVIDGSGNLYITSSNGVIKYWGVGIQGTFASVPFDVGITMDGGGNLFVTSSNNTVSKVTSSGAVSTFVASGLNGPSGITIDGSGNLYVTNTSTNTVSKIPANLVVCGSYSFRGQTLTASGTYIDTIAGGAVNGCDSIVTLDLTIPYPNITTISVPPTVSTFATGLNHPEGITIDRNGNLYVTNYSNGTVSKITASGTVSIFASGLSSPDGITMDGSGNLYVTNYGNNTVSKVTPSGVVSAFATAGLNGPTGITIDGSGNLYVTNGGNNTISKISSGLVSTFASVGRPEGITIDGNGNLYVTNDINGVVNKVTPLGVVSTFAAGGLNGPVGITIDSSGNLYVTNISNNTVSKITSWGLVSTTASVIGLGGIAIDGSGNLYVTIPGYNTVSKISTSIMACSSYTFRGQMLTASGIYSDTIAGGSVSGCDSIVTLYLTIKNNVAHTLTDTACTSYTFNGQAHTSSGTYIDTIAGGAVNGCDSIVTLHLTIKNNVAHTLTDTACTSYTFTGHTLTASGTYIDTITGGAVNGCDSIVTLHLTIKNNATSAFADTACISYTFNGQPHTISGTYYDTIRGGAVNGCDSIVTLHLTIKNNATSTLTNTACNSYTFNGQTLTASGTYHDTIPGGAMNGCDSIVTLHLTIHRSTSSIANNTICTSALPYSWNGQTLTTSGTYYDTLNNTLGCDSTLTLHLTIHSTSSSTSYDTISSGALPYIWNGLIFTTDGTQTAQLINSAGCDSAATLILTTWPNGISEISDPSQIRLYPNPNRGSFTLATSGSIGSDYTISDMLGHVIAQQIIRSDSQSIELPEATEGVYTLSIKGAQAIRFAIVR